MIETVLTWVHLLVRLVSKVLVSVQTVFAKEQQIQAQIQAQIQVQLPARLQAQLQVQPPAPHPARHPVPHLARVLEEEQS